MSSRDNQISADASAIWACVKGDLSEAFLRLGWCKSDLTTWEDIRYWQEVERLIVHKARRDGFFGTSK